MALLRFDVADCRVDCSVNARNHGQFEARDRVEVRLGFAPAARARLAEALGGISAREGSELRTEFAEGWTIYWKLRAGESRFFVAHPETDQWVATLALSATHLETVRGRLIDGVVGPISPLEAVSRMSNVEVVFA